MRINKKIIQVAQFTAGEYCTGRMLRQLPHELLRPKKKGKNQQSNNKIKPLDCNQKRHAKILPIGNTYQIELKHNSEHNCFQKNLQKGKKTK